MFKFLRKFFQRRPAKHATPRFAMSATTPLQSARPAAAPRPPTAPVPAARQEWEKQALVPINPGATPEQICGITSGMTREEISAQLAMLYRRHNRAASSLEAHLREEAEYMLDLVARMRQKHLR
jgi:hypothetical protein